MKINNVELTWLGHDGFRIKDLIDDRVIYIDPYKIEGGESADIILITHSHYDHLSIEDMKKVSTPNTVILAPADCQSKFQGKLEFRDCKIMNPGSEVTLGNISIEAVPAYNTDKKFHPKGNEWVGYILDINSKRIYHAGDTDAIPEMNALKNIDIALMPVSGTYVMTAEEAAKATNTFNPKIAVPMHYGEIVGEKSDAEKFKELCECDVEILEKEK